MRRYSVLLFAVLFLGLLTACGPKITGTNKVINNKIDALFNENNDQYSHVDSEYGIVITASNNSTHTMRFINEEVANEEERFYFFSNSSTSNVDKFVKIEELDGVFYHTEAEDWVYTISTYNKINSSDFESFTYDYKNQFDVFFEEYQFDEDSSDKFSRSFQTSELKDFWMMNLFQEALDDADFTDFSTIEVQYVFTEHGLDFSLIQRFNDTSSSIESGYVYYNATLSFDDEKLLPDIDLSAFYLEASEKMQDSESQFSFGDEISIGLQEGSNNFVRLYLKPGNYRVNALTAQVSDYTYFDSDGNELGRNDFINVENEGFYYVQFTAKQAVKINGIIQGAEMIDVCDESKNECTSVVAIDDYDYIVIDNANQSSMLKITLTSITEYGLAIIVNGIRQVVYENNSVVFSIEENQNPTLMIESLISGYTELTEVDYIIEYEFVSLDSNVLDYSQMTETFVYNPNSGENVEMTMNFSLTEENDTAYLKFVIEEEGQYMLYFDQISSGDFCSYVPFINLYNDDYELITNSFEESVLSPGNYYVEVILADCSEYDGHLHIDYLE